MTSRVEKSFVPEDSVQKLPEFPQLFEIFHIVTSQEPPLLTKSMCKFSVSELESNLQATKTMMIFRLLSDYKSIRKSGATAADVYLEAVLKEHITIMAPLMARTSPEELGKGFLYACDRGSLGAVRMILEDGRLSSADLGNGFLVACRKGNIQLTNELKFHPQMKPESLDEGYCVAYDEIKPLVMEIISDKVSSAGIGRVFIQACKSGRNSVAENLMRDPRLSFKDLQAGLSIAEDLKSSLDSKTRTQLFLYNNRKFLFMGGLLAAGLALYPPVAIPQSLKTVVNTDSFFANTERCNSPK